MKPWLGGFPSGRGPAPEWARFFSAAEYELPYSTDGRTLELLPPEDFVETLNRLAAGEGRPAGVES